MEQKATFGTFKLKFPEREINGIFTEEWEYKFLGNFVNKSPDFKDLEYFILSRVIDGEVIEIDVLKEPISSFENKGTGSLDW